MRWLLRLALVLGNEDFLAALQRHFPGGGTALHLGLTFNEPVLSAARTAAERVRIRAT